MSRFARWSACVVVVLAQLVIAPPPASAAGGAVVPSADCTQNELSANDDASSTAVTLPFGIDFYGRDLSRLWVNNNGNVTFDGPLSTFTPFGLSATRTAIIAPFFADVDTRPAGSAPTRYGFGTTTYQGHAAFCVDWVDVGYFSRHDDRTNSFQLLLVQRTDAGPGDFDIVFNYDRVQWETGDASGGSGGLGGSSASAGFSNGTGDPGTSFEIPGSLVPGSFLDGGQQSLVAGGTDSAVPGRYTYRVRNGAAPLTRYVALGDSYASGEGAGAYASGTDDGSNRCHRSANAYAELLVRNGTVPLQLDFGACSGATISDLYQASAAGEAPWDDGRQLDRLDTSTALVTLGIGGNDLGFADVLASCIGGTVADALNPFHDQSCAASYNRDILTAYNTLVSTDGLLNAYRDVRAAAPYARILLTTYPHFFPPGGAGNRFLDNYCGGVRRTDQIWMNGWIDRLNRLITAQAARVGIQVVDLATASAGRELCTTADAAQQFLNGIRLPPHKPESYHPTALGQSLVADRLSGAIAGPRPGTLHVVRPQQSISTLTVVSSRSPLHISTSWPGSDVVTSLVSPSGVEYSRQSTRDAQHDVGPTYETWTVPDPEPGQWTVQLYGAQVAPEGEDTYLSIVQDPAPVVPPVARFTQTTTGSTTAVDAGTSSDDGTITGWTWDFGDGSTATGPRASHTYSQPGSYLTTLAVTDDDGEVSVVDGTTVVEVADVQAGGSAAPTTTTPPAGGSAGPGATTSSLTTSADPTSGGTAGSGPTPGPTGPSGPLAVTGGPFAAAALLGALLVGAGGLLLARRRRDPG